MRRLALSAVVLAAAGLAGCCPVRAMWPAPRDFNKDDLARVERGMSRWDVMGILGRPTDDSQDAMHWEVDRYTDAWVFFGGAGQRVTGTHWQDGQSLRLTAMPPVGE